MIDCSIHAAPIASLIADAQIRRHFDEESIEGLAQSIRELGVIQPIYVKRRDRSLVIIDGERRFRAAKKAGLATVPVIVQEDDLPATTTLQTQLVANCQREDLAPLEKARGIALLMKHMSLSPTQVATKLGVANSEITRSLAILSLPQAIREQVNAGQIPASAAYDLARVKDAQQQADLAKRLADGDITRDAVAGAVKSQKQARTAKERDPFVRVTVTLGPGRRITVTDAQLDIDRLIGSLEELLTRARKARTQGIELGTFARMLKDQIKP